MKKCHACAEEIQESAVKCRFCGESQPVKEISSTKSENEKEPIISFKGRNGKIELYRNFVRLNRGTVMGFLAQGLKGQKDIYFNSITSIQIKKPGLAVGYIQFSIPGGNESRSGVFSAFNEENTISFATYDKYEMAVKIKEYIEDRKQIGSQSLSIADEIEKLHSLMKRGILSKEEFEAKKKKLLII